MVTPFPHYYEATAAGAVGGDVTMSADRVPALQAASPVEFGGPGERWSPETLLVGAVADCFVLTFRALTRVSKLPWSSLECQARGTLDRIDRVTQFTHIELRARLCVPNGTDVEQARRTMEKAEQQCLISNSLKATIHLDATVDTSADDVNARCA